MEPRERVEIEFMNNLHRVDQIDDRREPPASRQDLSEYSSSSSRPHSDDLAAIENLSTTLSPVETDERTTHQVRVSLVAPGIWH